MARTPSTRPRTRELFTADDQDELDAFLGWQRGYVRRMLQEMMAEWER